jgi:melanoma-associated antigen
MAFYQKVLMIQTQLRIESMTRYLTNLHIEDNTPLMTTDKFLVSLVKQGYIEKIKDTVSGEQRYDYHLGPRGKIEVGRRGTIELAKEVH